MDQATQHLFDMTIKKAGHSVTRPRRLVFDLLWEQPPASMRELYLKADGQLDRSSLYRIIELFERTGIVQRVYIGWKYRLELTDIFAHHHHHITCLGCGRLIALGEDDDVERLIGELAERHHVKPIRHQLEIQGYCAACQAAGRN